MAPLDQDFIIGDYYLHSTVNKVELKNFVQVFKKVAPSGIVNRDQFKEALIELEQQGLRPIANTPYADRLYTLLDANEDGVVDLREFILGFSLLCNGSAEEKIRGKMIRKYYDYLRLMD